MKYIIKIILIFFTCFLHAESKDLENCEWMNKLGNPCLTIFSTPNTSELNEKALGKTVITKKQMIESG